MMGPMPAICTCEWGKCNQHGLEIPRPDPARGWFFKGFTGQDPTLREGEVEYWIRSESNGFCYSIRLDPGPPPREDLHRRIIDKLEEKIDELYGKRDVPRPVRKDEDMVTNLVGRKCYWDYWPHGASDSVRCGPCLIVAVVGKEFWLELLGSEEKEKGKIKIAPIHQITLL